MADTTGASSIYGALEGIASNASGLQEVSDTQAAIMQHLGSICDGLAPNLQGMAGTAMQQAGQQLHAHGMRMASAFADHSHMMNNNASLLSGRDQENAHILGQVANLT
ncbi:hypothetical protein [Mycobacterium sp. SP-6446]|uniref:hypothetical protein n=1 Tax=Mycobacterium sp. SP-6446 TaxID=1834162 RepID=UPI001115578F|nr:hypothetical protein [Mycobacterium sp. SP-6446]